jgi:hypothetical protein
VEGAGGMMPTAGNVMLQIGRRDKRKQCFFEKKHQYSDSLRIRFPLAARRDIDSAWSHAQG